MTGKRKEKLTLEEVFARVMGARSGRLERLLADLEDESWQQAAADLEEMLKRHFEQMCAGDVSPSDLGDDEVINSLAEQLARPKGAGSAPEDPLCDPRIIQDACFYASEAMMRGMPPLPYCGLVAGHQLRTLALTLAEPKRARGRRGPTKNPRARTAEIHALVAYYAGPKGGAGNSLLGEGSHREQVARDHGMSVRTLDRVIAKYKYSAK